MIKTMNVEELKQKMDDKANIVLVDCREQDEWDNGHIPGALFIPLSELEDRFTQLKPNDEIIMQCRSGVRSLKACQFLLEQDFENLTNLEGGILDWESKGFPIER